MRRRSFPLAVSGLLPIILTLFGCRSDDDALARQMCAEARDLSLSNPRAALTMQRKIWETLPTTGTSGAIDCGREIREKMGKVRSLVARDKSGEPEVVEGCEWAATTVEVFEGSTRLPYRDHWARRLMERCVKVVGRAWARDPDSEQLQKLNDRLKALSEN